MRRTALLIVGGGPAGSAAAIALGQAGLRAELAERTVEPHDVVCGGFLGWDALAALGRLGVDASALGARPIARMRLVSASGRVEAKLPRTAAGLSRRRLDLALLQKAAEAGAIVSRGRSARAADPENRIVRFDDGEEVEAEKLLLATGKHELRGAARPRDTSGDPVGLRAALEPSAALDRDLEGVIELHLFEGGYAGLLLQEDGRANLCLSAARERLREAGGVEPLIASLADELPELRRRLDQAAQGEWSAISGVPYGWRTASTRPGLYRLGDQAAVIASLAGDGIAIALTSGLSAAAAIGRGEQAPAWQRKFALQAAAPLAIAEGLRWAAERKTPRSALMSVLGRLPGLPGLAASLTRIGR